MAEITKMEQNETNYNCLLFIVQVVYMLHMTSKLVSHFVI